MAATGAASNPPGAGPAVPMPPAIRDSVSFFALGAAGANVIMQLSRLPVGHGVAKSTVDSGRIDKHPLKRLRTTLSYIMVAVHGTDREREAMRQEVNKSHRPVHSGPDESVRYNAFDRDLQLWVAACLYWGLEDLYLRLYGKVPAEQADAFYQYGAHFGTTLQVTQDMWPADREAFEEYWNDSLKQVEMDDLTRAYLYDFSGLGFLPAPVRLAFGPLHRFLTAGYLPPRFREELGLRWSPRHQRRFDRYDRTAAAVNRALPRPAREFPWNVYLWDVRRRIRKGRSIV